MNKTDTNKTLIEVQDKVEIRYKRNKKLGFTWYQKASENHLGTSLHIFSAQNFSGVFLNGKRLEEVK